MIVNIKSVNNKNGFTLIELLAVIIILALIMGIAVVSMSGILDNAKANTTSASVESILDGVSKAYKTSMLSGISFNLPLEVTITSDGVVALSQNGNSIVVDYKGENPTGGKIIIDRNEKVYADGITFDNGYICSMSLGEKGCGKVTINANMPSSEAIDLIVSKNTGNIVSDANINGRRVIKGGNPNNYIRLYENGEPVEYRIMSIESDGSLKVIRNAKTGKSWDSATYNSSLGLYTEGPRYNEMNTYCNRLYENNYYGCNAWRAVSGSYANGSAIGTVTMDSTMNTYLNNTFYQTLDADVKELIISHNWSIGSANYDTISRIESQENADKWVGKVGLMSISDYVKASGKNTCTATTMAASVSCGNDNYINRISEYQWTITSALYGATYKVYFVSENGSLDNYIAKNGFGGRPAFYLTSDIKLKGEGTSLSPFLIR